MAAHACAPRGRPDIAIQSCLLDLDFLGDIMHAVNWLEPVQLATRMRQKASTLVVDVRDDDFKGGNIKGAVNLPSETWHDDGVLDKFIKEHVTGVEAVVVHCMFSQQRGPRCARQLSTELAKLANEGQEVPIVYCLRGGWQGFVSQYWADSDLLAGLEDNPE